MTLNQPGTDEGGRLGASTYETSARESATTMVESKGTYILCKVVAAEAEAARRRFEQLWTPPEGSEPPAQACQQEEVSDGIHLFRPCRLSRAEDILSATVLAPAL